MSSVKLVVSDLHLADGTSILDCFNNRQQTAFEGLLAAASTAVNAPFSHCEDVEVIINGDCFDFLVTTPYTSNGIVDVKTAVQKIDKIIAAHPTFFAALRTFLAFPKRSITFITGNHDLELCFAEIRARISTAIIGNDDIREDERIYFCPTRFYRPLPGIHIEHGNHYDFWNHATQGLWDEQGQPLDRNPETITLSAGSRYFQRAAHPINIQYAYFDHLDPSINTMRQIAFLCLLDPDLLMKVDQDTMQLLSYPRKPLAHLSLIDRRNPVRLFEEAIRDFAAFQTDMVQQKRDWTPIDHHDEAVQVSQEEITEFMTVHEALMLPSTEAVQALCTSTKYQMGDGVATAMHNILKNEPALRYAIAGHTHQTRIDQIAVSKAEHQSYFNTGSWTTHLALPAPNDVTPALVEWFRSPDWHAVPLRDTTQFVFVLITTAQDDAATACLCAWEGGKHGNYQVLAYE